MNNKRIIYPTPEGGVAVIIPAPECGLTIEEIAAKDVPEGKTFQIVNVTDIPEDRTFRNAWRKGLGKVDIDLPAATEITHEKRRAKRATEFAPLDIKATIPSEAAAAETARAAIRAKFDAIQADIDACSDVAALKSIIGSELL